MTSGLNEVFGGSWTYRSVINDPDITQDFSHLEFGRGELQIERFDLTGFSGRLIFGDTYQFALTGVATFGDPYTVALRGIGDTADSANQIYDYLGYLVPAWREGVHQVPAFVGSVLRAVPHGTAPAGVVASWTALKR